MILIYSCIHHRMQTLAEERVGEHQPIARQCKKGQYSSTIHDFKCYTAKWYQATIIKQTRLLTYA